MSDVVKVIEIILSWIMIFEILLRMVEGGLVTEIQNLIDEIRRKRSWM